MPTANEKLMDKIIKHRAMTAGVENSIYREARVALTSARRDIVDQLVGASSRSLSKSDIDRLTVMVDARLEIAKSEVTDVMRSRMALVAESELSSTYTVMQAAIPAVVGRQLTAVGSSSAILQDVTSLPVGGVTFEKAISNMFDRTGNKVNAETQKAFSDAFRTSLSGGQGLESAMTAGVDASKNLRGNMTDIRKIMDEGAAKDLKGIVRNQTQRTLDEAQSRQHLANKEILQGVVFSSTLDASTCTACAALDGTMYWFDKIPPGQDGELYANRPLLPVHPGCRCTYISVVKGWEDLPVDNDKFSAKDKQVLDGDIPKPDKWEDWFGKQTATDQKAILGPGRHALWSSGRVPLKSFGVGGKTVPLKSWAKAAALPESATSLGSKFPPFDLAAYKAGKGPNYSQWLSQKNAVLNGRAAEKLGTVNSAFDDLAKVSLKNTAQREALLKEATRPAPTAQRFKTSAEAQAYAREHDLAANIYMKDFSPELANAVVDALEEAKAIAPSVSRYTRNVGTLDRYLLKVEQRSGKAAATRSRESLSKAFAVAEETRWDNPLRGVYFNHTTATAEALARNQASGWLATGTLNGTATHEMAHLIDKAYKLSKSKTIISEFKSYKSLSIRNARNSLSGYAQTNIGEFIAENWAEFQTAVTPRPLAKRVGQTILEIIKKVDGG